MLIRVVSIVILLCVSTACSSNAPLPETAPVINQAELLQAGLDFEPTVDGFSFANFSGGQGDAQVRAEDLVDMFGRDGLCMATDTDECVPYPGVSIFLERLNTVLASGLCYGMSSVAMNYFGGGIALADLGIRGSNLIEIPKDKAIQRLIAKHHVMQFSNEYRDSLDQFLTMAPVDIAEELWRLFSDIDNSSIPYALALYTVDGGHSVTPTRIQKFTDSYRVFVYDSNWPQETRWVDINRGSNGWSYQATSKNNQSTENLWTGVGPGSMTLIPQALPGEQFTCFFCQNTGAGDFRKSSGSVLMLDTADIGNTAITIHLDNGNEMYWSTRHRSGMSEIKVYRLPSQSASDDSSGGAVMVFIPSLVGSFEIALSQITNTRDSQAFSAILTGPDVPTTEIRGSTKGDQPTTVLDVSSAAETGNSVVTVEGSLVDLVRGAHYRSSAYVGLRDDEMYKIETSERNIENIQVVEIDTGESIISLGAIMRVIDTPLRRSNSEEGISFSRSITEENESSVSIVSSDQNRITSKEALKYEVAFSDGTSALFGRDENQSMMGVFSDGSVSIRDDSGSGTHITNDGWIINELHRGELKVLRQNEEGEFTLPSTEDVSNLDVATGEIHEILRGIINSASIRPSDDLSESGKSGSRDDLFVNLEELNERIETLAGRHNSVENVKDATTERGPEDVNLSGMLEKILETVTDSTERVMGITRFDGAYVDPDLFRAPSRGSDQSSPRAISTPFPTPTPTVAPSRKRPISTPVPTATSTPFPTPTPTVTPSRSQPTSTPTPEVSRDSRR